MWSARSLTADVHRRAVLWSGLLLLRVYSTCKKTEDSLRTSTVRFERLFRSGTNFVVLWHQLEAGLWYTHDLASRYPRVPSCWDDLEVPWGVWAELQTVFVYKGPLVLQNPSSSCWVVQCTGWALAVADVLVFNAYDTLRMWWVPSWIRFALGRLGGSVLRQTLGDKVYADKLHVSHDLKTIAWTSFPRENNQRPLSMKYPFCVGRDASAGDFVWFDPVENIVLDEAEAKRRRAKRNAKIQGGDIDTGEGGQIFGRCEARTFEDVGITGDGEVDTVLPSGEGPDTSAAAQGETKEPNGDNMNKSPVGAPEERKLPEGFLPETDAEHQAVVNLPTYKEVATRPKKRSYGRRSNPLQSEDLDLCSRGEGEGPHSKWAPIGPVVRLEAKGREIDGVKRGGGAINLVGRTVLSRKCSLSLRIVVHRSKRCQIDPLSGRDLWSFSTVLWRFSNVSWVTLFPLRRGLGRQRPVT